MDVRFAVYHEGPYWVAQGVEIDICVSDRERDALPEKCHLVMCCEDLLPGGLARIGPPPRHIAKRWDKHGGIVVNYERTAPTSSI